MKKLLLSVFLLLAGWSVSMAQCTTTNATSCQCKDPNQTDCDLLPDIEIGHPPFYQIGATYGVIEYSQTGNGVDNGRLKVSVSTPNTGHGPLELRTTNIFICGTDTFVGTAPSICPDGVSYPGILINQRIYHKNGSTMSYYDRAAGTMTYHPTHGHMHVDNWGTYTLREQDPNDPNPLHWPIIGSGTKLAFCVMDYGSCDGSSYQNHCLDTAGNPMNNSANYPNYGLGGGAYNCSPTVQGISSGYLDIYWTSLDGMWIDIPPGICNGEYWIVTEVDPNNNFLEEYENNNFYAAPFTLQRQEPNPATTPSDITIAGSKLNLCPGESVTLTGNSTLSGVSYQWVTGDTTASISVSQPGTYTVNVTNQCGSGSSLPVTITAIQAPADPVASGDTLAVPGTANLSATANGSISWWDAASGGTQLGTGSNYTTPIVYSTTTFYVQNEETTAGQQFSVGPATNTSLGAGASSTATQSLLFDCLNPFVLHSVDVYATTPGTRTIQLKDNAGTVIQSLNVTVVAGLNTLVLDFPVNPGTGYQLTRTGGELYRNSLSSNAGYPYTIANFCKITSSTAGANYYYFFYNWDVRLPSSTCSSARIPVDVVVSSPNIIGDVAQLTSLNVFPNPATNRLIVSFDLKSKSEVTIQLIDAIGHLALSRNLTESNGHVEEAFDVSALAKGVYSIHILSNNKNYYHKLIVQ
jgi:hypothetical protein